ncbi:MAG: histidine--tRNA ligase [Bacteroidales bacterium]|nr:histidine--tRNA ligase [Bacteroidales bacterium]
MVFPRKIKGFRDIDHGLNSLRWHIIEKATEIYKRFGFEHWDSPTLEYAETLGKYLPEADEVVDGVYSFKNPEIEPQFNDKGTELRDKSNNVLMTNHHLTMRYDLTAPLARMYSELIWQKFMHNQVQEGKADLFRRFQFGPVYRFEAKLDPGRFREFWQIDFDTVGSDSVATDAENCMILSDALENIGIKKGEYIIKLNNRKIIKGFLESIGVKSEQDADVMRVIDKLDKIGITGVTEELGKGRKDEKSGAFITGLGLNKKISDGIEKFLVSFDTNQTRKKILESLSSLKIDNEIYVQGLAELLEIDAILEKTGYDEQTVIIDPSMIRGMGYYTGPIFEAEYLGTYKDAKGQKRKVGSICGGGRYDGLVENLIGLKVPASGASIGVDRLAEIMTLTGKVPQLIDGPVFIVNFDDHLMPEYQKIASDLRKEGLEVEIYYGAKKGLKQQLSYADKKNCTLAIIIGEDEFNKGVATVKNLKLGKELADKISDKKEWTSKVQKEIKVDKLVKEIQKML